MSKLKNPTIQGNRVKTKQVEELISKYPDLKKLCTIPEGNAGCYVLGCITNSVDSRGTTTSRVVGIVKDVNSWEIMRSHDGPAFNCHIPVILHNPALEAEESFVPFETNGRLTDKKKENIIGMGEGVKTLDDGSLDEIAEENDVSFHALKKYVNSLTAEDFKK